MVSSLCGSDTSTSVAPCASSSCSAARCTRRWRCPVPRRKYSSGRPMRRPSRLLSSLRCSPQRGLGGGGVQWVVPGHGVQQQGAIFGAARHGARLVQAGGEGHHAQAGYPAVGGFQAGNAAKGRGLADGAPGIGAGGGRGQQAATAAAEPPEEPPGTRSVFQGLRTGP